LCNMCAQVFSIFFYDFTVILFVTLNVNAMKCNKQTWNQSKEKDKWRLSGIFSFWTKHLWWNRQYDRISWVSLERISIISFDNVYDFIQFLFSLEAESHKQNEWWKNHQYLKPCEAKVRNRMSKCICYYDFR
jgi:hypothetical protein